MNWIQQVEKGLSGLSQASPKELRVLMQGLDLSLSRLEPYISEPHALPYGRTSIVRSEEAEAVLIHLPAGKETFIHDHGDAVGCMFLVQGMLVNRMFRLDSYGYPHQRGEAAVAEHSFFYAPKNQIHQLVNPGESRALSFHIYTPAPAKARTYLRYEEVLDYVI
ncbi:cysteine dioxygenase [Paenibacillus caseinilyticus]|uniref:cysteine dioxygenase n=1 Tax=Paenibacillus caseinilyticus TaxID=3098138 RepID=UPI0022B9142B|nr:cysteine dioxygenase family protein [Paenibacillus caseinilyticus]MCZ8519239.1 cysteine dioxygenase family protein [Paenibacillus caseinilyticus]